MSKEAATCREMAREFAGRPEGAFLLRIASEFEELAGFGRPAGPDPR